MAVKKRFVECECGEVFIEGKNNQLEGNTALGPWRLKDNRKRQGKTTQQGDILAAIFERSVFCIKCKNELMREKRQYELTPPVTQSDEPVTSYSTREFVYRQAPKPTASDLSAVNISVSSEGYNAGELIAVDQVIAGYGKHGS